MKTIVVPTDFSPVATNAAYYGAELAASINASLTLLHICELPVAYGEIPVPLPELVEINDVSQTKMEQLKQDLQQKKGEHLKIYTDIRVGSIQTELKSYCERINPYAVVMGSHGASAIERLLFGSNTIWAMKHLSSPLVVVPSEAKYKAIHTIGLACDFKRVIDAAPIKEIRKFVNDLHADLHVLYINTEETKDHYDAVIIEGSGMLQEMLGDLDPHYHFVDHPQIEEGLTEYAERYCLDMLIVVPKRHNLIDRIMHRSHTKQLALHTHMPLMAVHE